MNYLKRVALFVLLLPLLNSSLWCMESITSIETGSNREKEIEEILKYMPSLENLFYFMCWARSYVPHFNADSIAYIGNILSSLVLKDSLECNFTHVKKVQYPCLGDDLATSCSDGKTTVLGLVCGEIWVWNIETERLLTKSKEKRHSGSIMSIAFSANGETFATGSSDCTVCLWNARRGNFIRRFKGHSKDVWSVALSYDGKTVASGSRDNTLCLWNAESGGLLGRCKQSDAVNSVAFSPDGKTIFFGLLNDCDRVYVWNIGMGGLITEFKIKDGPVTFLALSANGKLIFVDSSMTGIYLWDVTKGKLIQQLKHSASVRSLVVSSDGKTIITMGDDDILCFWRNVPCEAARYLLNQAHNFQLVGFIIKALEEKNSHGAFIIAENSPEDKILAIMDLDVQKYLIEWYSVLRESDKECIIAKALKEKSAYNDTFTLDEDSLERKIFMNMPENIKEYLIKSYYSRLEDLGLRQDLDLAVNVD